jgi:hypothetical protein
VRLVSVFLFSLSVHFDQTGLVSVRTPVNSNTIIFIYFLYGLDRNIVICATGCLCMLKFLMQFLCHAIYLYSIIFIILDCIFMIDKHVLPVDVLLLTRSENQSNQFSTPVRPVWCVQGARSVRPIVIIGQTGLCVASYHFSFSCMPTPIICITYTCMAPSHLSALSKIERYREVSCFLLNMCK